MEPEARVDVVKHRSEDVHAIAMNAARADGETKQLQDRADIPAEIRSSVDDSNKAAAEMIQQLDSLESTMDRSFRSMQLSMINNFRQMSEVVRALPDYRNDNVELLVSVMCSLAIADPGPLPSD